MTWKKTLGRVAFLNCDPLFHTIDNEWNVLSAPPSWLTGHILRRDCIIAPIPAADYAKHQDKLILIPNIGICSKGEVGSVLLFSDKSPDEIKTVAMPTDSATSVALCKHFLAQMGLSPTYVSMGPDIESMLNACDAALLIGDRALNAAKKGRNVLFDLGEEWFNMTSLPMVFGVFVARKDSNKNDVKRAHDILLKNLKDFENNSKIRRNVIEKAEIKSNLSQDRLERYYGEVFNRLDSEHIRGLTRFLSTVENSEALPEFLEFETNKSTIISKAA